MAGEFCLSAQKVRLPQNGSDFGGNPLAFDCTYELGSLLLHNGAELIKSWSLKAKIAICNDTTVLMHSIISRTNTKNVYFLLLFLVIFNVHGSVHRNNIPIYIQQDAMLHSLFYLETALHVLGGTTTHHQECKQLSTASGICHTVAGLSVLWVAYATHSTLKPVPTLPR
jgi:hypothetical protein